jgi:N-acetylneuraminic acid mutarotase
MSKITRRTALATAAGALASPVRAEPPRWKMVHSVLWPVQEVYCTIDLDGRIVIAGGMHVQDGKLRILDNSAAYYPQHDTWMELSRLPSPRHHPVLATAAGRVMAFGGYGQGAGPWTAMRQVFFFRNQAWFLGGLMPKAQSETVALTLGERVHLIGGRAPKGEANAQWQDQGDIALHQVFDPATERWQEAAPAPTARNSAAGAVIGGLAYVVGGRTVAGGNLAALERYDPKADMWETLRPMPQASGGLAAATVGGRLYAFGGEWFEPGGGGVYRETFVYDPKTDQWEASVPMRTPRHGLAAAAVGGTIYAIGGGAKVSGGQTTPDHEALTP